MVHGGLRYHGAVERQLRRQLAAVESQIKTATDQRPTRFGAEPVTLVAVSKRQPGVKIDAALLAGHRVIFMIR